jgi:hypothetical protein
MKIDVIRPDKTTEQVEDSFLQVMIDRGKVAAFRRSNGWAHVGADPIRSTQTTFTGKDRRSPDFGA